MESATRIFNFSFKLTFRLYLLTTTYSNTCALSSWSLRLFILFYRKIEVKEHKNIVFCQKQQKQTLKNKALTKNGVKTPLKEIQYVDTSSVYCSNPFFILSIARPFTIFIILMQAYRVTNRQTTTIIILLPKVI